MLIKLSIVLILSFQNWETAKPNTLFNLPAQVTWVNVCETDQIVLLEDLLAHRLNLADFNDEVFKAAKRKWLNAHIYAYVEREETFQWLPETVRQEIKSFSSLTVRQVNSFS